MRRMRVQSILEIACLLVTLYATEESFAIGNDLNGEVCETPDHWEGECIELHKCPALLALTEKTNRSRNETTLLDQSGCGNNGLVVYVCCRFPATDLLPDSRTCGQSFHNRIFSGSSTHINEYPWTALIVSQGINDTDVSFCGGSLINNRYVLTAAHCLTSQKNNAIKAPVFLGDWNITTDPDCEVSRNGQRYCADPRLSFEIEEYILHPNFTPIVTSPMDDIALIRLDRYVTFTEFIQPVCLPIQPRLRSKTYAGSQMIAIGWGATATGAISDIKQTVYLEGVNLDACSKMFSKLNIPIVDTHLCAGGEGAGVCHGDSGGPLVYQESVDFRDVYVLVGITSLVDLGCREKGGIGIFTRVGPYMDWIQDNLKP